MSPSLSSSTLLRQISPVPVPPLPLDALDDELDDTLDELDAAAPP
jgi:hypothetical protein